MSSLCTHCEKPITGAFINLGLDGRMHSLCYRLRFPFKPRLTFLDVLLNSEDQVIVRELLHEHVPDDVKQRIVVLFNKIMSDRHSRYERDAAAGKTI